MAEFYSGRQGFPTRQEIIGIVVALLPFVLFFGTSSSTTVNGVVVESSRLNYAAIILGPIAAIIGLRVAMFARTALEADRIKHYAAAAAIIILGVFQTLRGLGVI